MRFTFKTSKDRVAQSELDN